MPLRSIILLSLFLFVASSSEGQESTLTRSEEVSVPGIRAVRIPGIGAAAIKNGKNGWEASFSVNAKFKNEGHDINYEVACKALSLLGLYMRSPGSTLRLDNRTYNTFLTLYVNNANTDTNFPSFSGFQCLSSDTQLGRGNPYDSVSGRKLGTALEISGLPLVRSNITGTEAYRMEVPGAGFVEFIPYEHRAHWQVAICVKN